MDLKTSQRNQLEPAYSVLYLIQIKFLKKLKLFYPSHKEEYLCDQ